MLMSRAEFEQRVEHLRQAGFKTEADEMERMDTAIGYFLRQVSCADIARGYGRAFDAAVAVKHPPIVTAFKGVNEQLPGPVEVRHDQTR